MPSPGFSTANLVTIDEDGDVFMVGLAEHEDGSGACLILQAPRFPPTQSDLDNGFDTYCSVDEAQVAVHGGIRRAELRGADDGADDGSGGPATALLDLSYTPQAAERLGLAGTGGSLRLALPRGAGAELAGALRRVLTTGNPAHHPELVGI